MEEEVNEESMCDPFVPESLGGHPCWQRPLWGLHLKIVRTVVCLSSTDTKSLLALLCHCLNYLNRQVTLVSLQRKRGIHRKFHRLLRVQQIRLFISNEQAIGDILVAS